MTPFVFNTASSLHFGAGKITELGEMARTQMGERVMLISDPGLSGLGMVGRVAGILEKAGISVSVFADVQADPPESVIEAAVSAAKESDVQGIVGLVAGLPWMWRS